MIEHRRSQVNGLLEHHLLDALISFHLPNLRYLTGFTGTDGVLVVDAQNSYFLTDSRYTIQAKSQVSAGEIREYQSKIDGVTDFLNQSNYRRIGFEAETLPFATVEKLKEGSSLLEWVPLGKDVQKIRSRKDSKEIILLQKAATIAAEAFKEIKSQIKVGIKERDLALALEFAMRKGGAEEKAFDIIVASGERGALPHGIASEKMLREGELITIDFGCRYCGYHSDETVTLALGEPSQRMREVFDVVLRAHDLALEKVKPGILLKDLDNVARSYIADQGYGPYFGHGLGHGVGLEIHEYPSVSPRSDDLLQEGMVVTVEPGIYIPNEGGCRIEDTVVVTSDGYQLVTQLPKHYQQLQI